MRLLFFLFPLPAFCWGFFGHKWINRMAVTTLPLPMSAFYKRHLERIERLAVLPDQRRYIIAEEACRHYIDFEAYDSIPLYYSQAVAIYSEDTLMRHGTLPWNIQVFYSRLVRAFSHKDTEAIIKCSAEIGHYLADAHVPLHTTKNYNGQLTGQHGIHSLWETRLPELFFQRYSYYTGPALYVDSLPQYCRQLVVETHGLVTEVLSKERLVRLRLPESAWYETEQKGGSHVRVYSRRYAGYYHKLLDGMVEEQMKKAILSVGSIWYSAWIEAGQPDLSGASEWVEPSEEKEKENAPAASECNH